MHVYHYAPYEITALKRLMGRYGTREDELDDLLRRDVFVDLLRVVRNGIRTSRPGYGLKELETFLDFERRAEVKDGGTSIVVFEQWMQTRDPALLAQIDEYNEEDCIATLLLRDWLLELRGEAIARFGAVPAARARGAEADARAEGRARRAAAGSCSTPGEDARRAAARLPRPRAQAGLVGVLRPARDDAGRARRGRRVDRRARARRRAASRSKRSQAYTFTFPAQEHKIARGQDVRRPGDAAGRRASSSSSTARSGALVLKRGPEARRRAAAARR